MRRVLLALLAAGLLLLGGCGSTGYRAPAPQVGAGTASTPASGSPGAVPRRGGGYYQDDGPGENPPLNLEQTPDAVPRDEPPLKTAANRPYVVFGRTYAPTTGTQSFRQRGVASWYGRKFHGQKTSSGEPYNMYGMSAAHPTLPIPSYVRVTNLSNGRMVTVRVNDRGPFLSERIIDLSYTAALKLGYIAQGSTQVEIEQVRGNGAPPPPVMVASGPPAGAPAAASQPAAAAPASPRPLPVTPAPGPAMAAGASAPDGKGLAAATATSVPAAPAPVAQASATQAPAGLVPAAQVLPTSTQPDGIYLQLGAFGARDGAEEFRIKVYQQLGWLTETIYIVARDRLFRVQLGPYKDRGEAGGIAEKIRESLQLTPTFVLK